MVRLSDSPDRYEAVTRILHRGMAALFLAQFTFAAAAWALPRENALREALWNVHPDLGITLFLLFLLALLRGVWGLANIPGRPPHSGFIGRAAVVGHIAMTTSWRQLIQRDGALQRMTGRTAER